MSQCELKWEISAKRRFPMTLKEIEKRLKAMEDIETIKRLHNEYLFYLNNSQWQEMADCFTENATANIHELHKGRGEILKFFTEVIAKLNAGKGRDAHFAVQPVITVDGNRAQGHWLIYIFIADPTTGNALRWIQGRYDCEYVKEYGNWKFSSLTYTSPWPSAPENPPKH
jgi:hypothetical protein